MRNKLETEIVNILIPYRDRLPFDEIRDRITIVLNDYEIEARNTEIAIRDEDKNNYYIGVFLAAKAASGRTERTLKHYKAELGRILNGINRNVEEITADDIKLYLARRIRVDKVSKTYANNARLILSTFFDWLHKNEYITKNPMYKVEAIKFNKPKKSAFTDLEVEKLRDACRTERERMVVEVLLSTWCRVSELCGIRLDEIENERVLVHGKGEKDRTVFLNAKAQIAIQKFLDKRSDLNPYLIPGSINREGDNAFMYNAVASKMNKDELIRWYENPELVSDTLPIEKGTIESMLRDLGKRAKVSRTHPHKFRRTGATFALNAGMPITTISKILGHANVAVTQVYLDINDDDLELEHAKYVR